MTPPDKAVEQADLTRLLAVLWQGRRQILSVAALVMLLGAALALSMVPLYQANSLVQLEERRASLAVPEAMQDLLGGGARGVVLVETETEILRSRLVLGEAVRQLRLTQIARPRRAPLLGDLPMRLGLTAVPFFPAWAAGGERIRLAELKVPASWLGLPLALTHLGGGRYRLVLPDGSVLQGEAGAPLQGGPEGFSLEVAELQGAAGRDFILREDPHEIAVSRLQDALTVRPAGRSALMLRLQYLHPEPDQAVQILKAVAAAYVAQNIGRSAAEADNSLRFIEEQLPLAQSAVATAQQAMNAYQQSQKSVDVSYETRSLLEQATGLETRLNALILQEEELKKRFTPNHPTYQQLLETRQTLSRQLEELRRSAAALPETQREIFNLNRDLEVAAQVYTQMLNRAQELRVLRASTLGSVRVVDEAWSENQRVRPQLYLHLVLSAAIGLVTGALLVLARQALQRGLRSARQIEALGLPVLGLLPLAREMRRGRGAVLALHHPQSRALEGFRALGTALQASLSARNNPVVLITSADPKAGKSFTALNLALLAAAAGQRVCLIEGDLRGGEPGRRLGLSRDLPGLSDYLRGAAAAEAILQPGPRPGLSVILSGQPVKQPAELLMQPETGQLIASLALSFDLVVIDTPPALVVSDAVIWAPLAATRLVVVRHAKTLPGEIKAVQRLFAMAGQPLNGAVLNGYLRRAAPADQTEAAACYDDRYAPGGDRA